MASACSLICLCLLQHILHLFDPTWFWFITSFSLQFLDLLVVRFNLHLLFITHQYCFNLQYHGTNLDLAVKVILSMELLLFSLFFMLASSLFMDNGSAWDFTVLFTSSQCSHAFYFKPLDPQIILQLAQDGVHFVDGFGLWHLVVLLKFLSCKLLIPAYIDHCVFFVLSDLFNLALGCNAHSRKDYFVYKLLWTWSISFLSIINE